MPDDLNEFLTLCQKLQKIGHPAGFALGHAVGDANGYANWLLWTHGAYLVDEKGKVALDSKETIAALKYAKELQNDDDPRHAVLERRRATTRPMPPATSA